MDYTHSFLRMARRGNRTARKELELLFLNSALHVIKYSIIRLGCYSVEPEDYLLCYHQTFLKCVDQFDAEKGSFEAFLLSVLAREVNIELQNHLSLQKSIISLDEVSNDSGTTIHDIIPASDTFENNPSSYVTANEIAKLLLNEYPTIDEKEEIRNRIQRTYVMLRFSGYNKMEIYNKFRCHSCTIRKIIRDDGPRSVIGELKKFDKELHAYKKKS